MGKKADRGSYTRAAAFLLKPQLLPKLFGTIAQRYTQRHGGYTRIHKYGHRPGDNAPAAILELVDNPRDLRYEVTARAIGWELLKDKLKTQTPSTIIGEGIGDVQKIVESERRIQFGQQNGLLRPKTRWNLQKVLRFKDGAASLELGHKITRYVVSSIFLSVACPTFFVQDQLLAAPVAIPRKGREHTHAGQMIARETRSAMQLAQGSLGHAKSSISLHKRT